MPIMDNCLIKFVNVSKFYGSKKVVDNISFSLPRGNIVTLVGPNGAGKTTIAKLMMGAETVTSGNIFCAKEVSFGYVPQKIITNTNLPITASAFLDVLTKKSWHCASQIIDFAQIESIKDCDLKELSGGQLSRLFLASCLVNKANVIILDEPTKELDILAQSDFYRLLEDIKQNFNVTIFIISHDINTVVKSSDQVLCLNKHLCCYGKPMEQYNEILDHIGFYKHRHNHFHY